MLFDEIARRTREGQHHEEIEQAVQASAHRVFALLDRAPGDGAVR